MKKFAVWLLCAAASLSAAADIQGDWTAEISIKGSDPQYARVKLLMEGGAVSAGRGISSR